MQNTPTNARANLVVWHITDSALPTGAFAHSAGLETYIQRDEVHDPETYLRWLVGYLHQATYGLSLIHISEPTRHFKRSRMPSSA